MSLTNEQGYSATVELQLVVDGAVIPLSHVGPNHCILSRDHLVPAMNGEIVVVIDGNVQRTSVEILPHDTVNSRTIHFRRMS